MTCSPMPAETVDETRYLVTPEVFLPLPQARAWIRGDHAPGEVDPRRYYSEVPREDFEWEGRLRPPSEEQVQRRGEQMEAHRKLTDQLFPPGTQATGRKDRSRGER